MSVLRRLKPWVILIGFPLLYFIYSLTPLSRGLFAEGQSHLFIPFWSGIILLHWISLFVVLAFLKQEGKGLRDIGYKLTRRQTSLFICSYLLLALMVLGFTEVSLRHVSIDADKLAHLSLFFPRTTLQRVFYILIVFTAGFCEEIVYRGYAITKFTEMGLNRWLAIVPAGVAFVLMHGIASVMSYSQFLFYLIFALLFGVLFVSTRRLLPSMIVHLLFDLIGMMAIFQTISA